MKIVSLGAKRRLLGDGTYFRLRHGAHERGTRFLLRTTLKCSLLGPAATCCSVWWPPTLSAGLVCAVGGETMFPAAEACAISSSWRSGLLVSMSMLGQCRLCYDLSERRMGNCKLTEVVSWCLLSMRLRLVAVASKAIAKILAKLATGSSSNKPICDSD